MKTNPIKALSIQIRLSGLSFSILNRSTHTIEYLEHFSFNKKLTPFELLTKLKDQLENNSVFNQEFNAVQCIHQNELSTLVPEVLFDESQLANYLKFNAKILKTDFISYDNILTNNSVNVYVPWVNINNYLFDTFGSFVYKHISTVYIESIEQYYQNNSGDQLFINVDATQFQILAIRNKMLVLSNTFEFSSTEDFIYYVLFVVEQLKLDPETVMVSLSGHIENDDDLFKILYKYVRHVDFIKPNYKYRYAEGVQPENAHEHFLILKSF